LATGQAYVKSEAALRIARELPRWQWTWVFHFIPRVIDCAEGGSLRQGESFGRLAIARYPTQRVDAHG
jgi:hypothetical protein